jgi:hypothetical protein
MPWDILLQAEEQAKRSEPLLRAPALMRIARVQTALNPALARSTFENALAETKRIPGEDGEHLLIQARLLAAAVAPDLLGRFSSDQIVRIMLDHQHRDAAYDFVIHYDDPPSFPFGIASGLVHSPDDDERGLTVFRRAIDAWRVVPEEHFIWLFQSHWKLIPRTEAEAVSREIVSSALSQPDPGREHTLFQILHILRQIDAPLADSLIASNEQLAAAARRYPNGMESMRREAEARRVSNPPKGTGGYRTILYKAGKRLGKDAVVYLEAIPDADLKLFAQIELVAALTGLPELQGTQRQQRRSCQS